MTKLVLLLLLIVFLSGCEEDSLTEIKYDGTGGISCLVDGMVLKNGPSDAICKFTILENGIIILEIMFFDNTSQWVFESVYLKIYDIHIDNIIGSTYYLAEKMNNSSYAVYEIGSLKYETNKNNVGDFTISYYDSEKKVIAGYFSFNARGNGEVKKIKFGRFDLPINELK
ncbi:hypothetical protein [Namhaeicola litoreus]|uniref:Uncharacterized protein n=1 Tax=Namhaeicola litoreus TaxID=1052145 RepID=A0ABW3XXT0_9FLAO